MPILPFKSPQCKDTVFERNLNGTLVGAETEGKIVYLFSVFVFSFPSPTSPKFQNLFLTLDVFLIIYLLHEINCSLINLVQI